MVLKLTSCTKKPEPLHEIEQPPFFSDMPLVFHGKEAKRLYLALFDIASEKYQEAALLKACLYLYHVDCLNIADRKYFDLSRKCIDWIEKKHCNNGIVDIRTLAWKTDKGTIVPYKLISVAHPLITAGFKVNPLDANEVDDFLSRYEAIVPCGYGNIFKLFGYDFPEIMSQTKAARLLTKLLRKEM